MARSRDRARCARCGRALGATHKFCPNCGAPVRTVTSPASPGAGPSLQVSEFEAVRLEEERRRVTVLFADLSGSTALAERLDPEDLRQIMGSLFGALAREIQHYGGTIDKYIGDAVMAVFGAPIAHEDDPQRAIRAALAIQAALARQSDSLQRRYAVRLALRIGVNSGEVVAGLLAGDVPSAYMVTGDTVNTAQRLESAAPPGGILVGESTYRLAHHAFAFQAVAPLKVKGKSEPVVAYRVLGRRDEALDRDTPPFVGRDAELVRIHGFLAEAIGGRGQVVHLYGEPGVGKSRLLHEFLAAVPETFLRVRARCLSHETATPYALIADVIRRALRINVADDEPAARAALIEGFGQLASTAGQDAVPLSLEVLGYGQRSPVDPPSKQRMLIALLRRFLSKQSAVAPVVLVAEDVHWIDVASSTVFREIVADIAALPCLVLTTSRDPDAPWVSEPVRLEPLDDSAAALLMDRAASEPLEPKVRALLLERTGGNPLFIAEVVRSVGAQKTATVPATIHELLAARLDSLNPSPRRVAQRASVIGRTFSTRILARVVDEEILEPGLATLETEAFIRPLTVLAEPTYSFRHALMQEVAYQSQLIGQRRALHGQVGGAIEDMYRDRLDESIDVLAFHYGRSDNDDKALHWLVRAGDRARALFANDEALAYYGDALKRAPDGEGSLEAGSILERAGDVQALAGKYDEALANFRHALDRTRQPQRATAARVQRKIGMALRGKGAYPEAFAALALGKAALGEHTDVEAARIDVQIGQLHWRRGDYAAAEEALSQAVGLGTALSSDEVLADGLKQLGNVCNLTGRLEDAAEYYRRSREIYERLEDLVGIADVRSNLGSVYRQMSLWQDALSEYQASLALRERMGNLWGIASTYNNIGEVHRTRGDLDLAIPAYQRAVEIWNAMGHPDGVALALTGLGAARVESGDSLGGRANLMEAERLFAALESTTYLPDLYRFLASAELGAGDYDAATRAAERSLEVARGAHARHQEAITERVLGEIALARGERGRARTVLESSRRTLAELGETAELARTEAVLRQVSER